MAKAVADHRSEHQLFPPHTSQDPGFAFFVFLYRLREEIRARTPAPLKKPLPRYVARTKGGYSFQVYPGGPITRLHGEPGTPEFRRSYSAALVDAIAMENDSDE